jgi:DNA-binding response OmpR family regulator
LLGSPPVYLNGMGTNSTLLCIHRDPTELSLLQQNGYELLTATNGADGLRLFMSRSVDAIVLDYQLGLLDGGVVAAAIKKVKPQVPIVMLAEDMELPYDALKSVDALVAKSDGPHFLLATVHFVLNVKPVQFRQGARSQTPIHLLRPGASREGAKRRQANVRAATDERDAPFSPRMWRSIRNGTVQF